mmetsp:Transcript_74009/g.130742  ORF Transcript_74009/g.130742 Transcript_74009/m.130742 type:complete len:1319 (-) Transcript_74009:59-4015(-)|eukprot:CAMPEP_0197621738 /NCGR_PEP_ID=MMETSP1338-20131121/2221_1 /TAXON_ID=43686 ORGANISM="Pelagodinium beii, Strain RCC1491" /NCGR_SAMPLE_ID=MMETSP1338 /ASSEMBLY_ACC=CAM_ASM_000754 /LENGTH=1318 /DNA_ID=CAMNT_0043191273 /DNA_START=53 /DNA_END=4009 /DNA_ORIENTATION=-
MSESEVSLELVHAFGSQCGSVRDAVLFADDAGQQIVFPVGRQVAICHVENGEATFMDADSAEITATAISQDRSYLAVCERTSTEARICIFDLREAGSSKPMKTLRPVSGGATSRLVTVAWSAVPQDGGVPKYLAATTSGSEAAVIVMGWEAEKVLAKSKVSGAVDRMAFSCYPESAEISVSGLHLLRLLQLKTSKGETTMKIMPAVSGLDERAVRILDHAWLEGSRGVIAATVQEGHVYLLSAEELLVLKTIAMPFGEGLDFEELIAYCVKSFSQGFLLGGADGHVAVWEQAEDDGNDGSQQGTEDGAANDINFKHSNTVCVRRSSAAVVSMDLTGGEETLLLGFRDADMGVITVGSLYATNDEEVSCNIIGGGNHNGPITGLDMAVQRPVLATVCTKDSSVRVWNYAMRLCEIKSEFGDDAPLSVALHPFGYYMAVSFADKLRFYHILVKDLKLHKEFSVRGLKQIKFANGGHLLAAAQGKLVQIFSTRSLAKVTTLQSHTKEICDMSFDAEDQTLWTTGKDGKIVQWDTSTWQSVTSRFEQNLDPLALHGIAPGQATSSVLRNGKNLLQSWKEGDLEQEIEIHGQAKLGVVSHFPGSASLFAGTDKGGFRVYASLQGEKDKDKALKYFELGLHAAGACSHFCISADGRTVVTAGEDGAVFVLGATGLSSTDEAQPVAAGGEEKTETEEALASRAEIQRLESTFQALTAEHKVLSERIVAEASKLEEECSARVAEARQKDQAEIQELLRRIDALEKASDAKERESQRIMMTMESSHAEAADQLGNLYERKISHESDRLLALQMSKVRAEEEMHVEEDINKERLAQSVEAAEQALEYMIAQKELELKKQQDHLAFVQQRFEVLLDKSADSHDAEVTLLRQRGRESLEEQKKVEVRLRREQETLRRGLEMQEKDREHVEDKQQEVAMMVKSLKEQAEELKRTLHSLQGERADRELTLADKEQRIASYKMKEKTLKKFKLVLDQRLAEVTESLQPKDHLIKQLNQDLAELEGEFERQLADQRALEGQLEGKKQAAAALTTEGNDLRERIAEKDGMIFRFTNDVHNLVTKQKDLKMWPKEIRRLYHTHVCNDQHSQERLPLEEMQRQMRVVERRVTTLAAKGMQSRATCKLDIQRKANENATLVHELNELRVQRKSLQSQVRSLTQKLKQLEGGGNSGSTPALGGPSRKQAIEDGGITAGNSVSPAAMSPSPSAQSLDNTSSVNSPMPMPPRPPSATSATVREPTGSMPGPRQRSSSREQLLEGSRANSRTKVPPLSGPGKGAYPAEVLMRTGGVSGGQEVKDLQASNTNLRGQLDSLMKS